MTQNASKIFIHLQKNGITQGNDLLSLVDSFEQLVSALQELSQAKLLIADSPVLTTTPLLLNFQFALLSAPNCNKPKLR